MKKKPEWLIVLVPLIAMLVVAILGISFQAAMMRSDGPGFLSPRCSATSYSSENARSLGGMFSFASASQLLFSVQCVAALFALILIWRRGSTWQVPFVIAAVAIAVACALIPRQGYMPTTVQILTLQVEKQCPNAVEFVVQQERGGAFAVGLLVCSLSILLLPSDRDTDQDLASRMRSLAYVLYVGTALLIASMLRLSALYEWVVLVAEESSRESLKLLASSLMRVWGVYYTTLLATIYLPAYLILRKRGHALIEGASTEAEREKWLKDRGLALGATDILPRLVAILAPIIAGEAGKLVGLLGG
jgi:hypothetical protein